MLLIRPVFGFVSAIKCPICFTKVMTTYLILAGYEVLRLGRISRVHVTHPVGSGCVVAVYVVVQLIFFIHL